jgi:hypothetical protein
MVSELLLFAFLDMKVSKNVPVPGKDGKLKPATGLQMKPEVSWFKECLNLMPCASRISRLIPAMPAQAVINHLGL